VADPAYLLDAGVVIRWFIHQGGWQHACEVRQQFFAGTVALETVDSVRVEAAHVLRVKGLEPGRLSRQEYLDAVRACDDAGVIVHVSDVGALERAAALAADRSLRIFDALVVDRAIERNLTLLTTDRRLVHAVADMLPTELLRGLDGR